MSDGSLTFDTKIESESFNKGMDDLNKSAKSGFEKMADSAAKSIGMTDIALGTMLGNVAGKLIAGTVQGIGQFVTDSVQVASDLAEVQNVVSVTFGESTDEVNTWAKAAKTAYGMSELKAKKYTSTMGAMLKSMGLSGENVLDMSEGVAGLAGDMASFYNLDHDTAFDKIRAGIAGETEPLKQLGINMSMANLQAYAMSQGITTAYGEMTEAEKVTLRYNYLLSATADAQGDFARTSDSLANKQKVLDTTLEELSATVGGVFYGAASAGTDVLIALADAANTGLQAVIGLFKGPEEDGILTAVADLKSDFNEFEQQVKDSDTTFAENKDKIDSRYELASQYLAVLGALEQKDAKTDEDVEAMKAATNALVNLYPELKEQLDPVTGLFANGSAAVRDFIESLKELAVYELYEGRMKETAALIAEAYDGLVTANATLSDAIEARNAKQAESDAYIAAHTAVGLGQLDMIDATTSAYLLGVDGFTSYFDVLADGTVRLKEGEDAGNAYANATFVLAGLIARSSEKLNEYSDAADSAQQTVDGYTQSLDILNEEFQTIQDQQNAVIGSMNGTAIAAKDASKAMGVFSGPTDLDRKLKGLKEINDTFVGIGAGSILAVNSVKAVREQLDAVSKTKPEEQPKRGLLGLSAQAESTSQSLSNMSQVLSSMDGAISESEAKSLAAADAQQTAIDKNMELAELVATIKTNIETASAAGEEAVASLTAAKETIATDAQAAIDNMEALATSLGLYVTAMKDALVAIIADAEVEAATAGEAFAKGASDGYKRQPYLRDEVNASVLQALAAAQSYLNAFYSAGYNMAANMADGVRSGEGALSSAVSAIVRSALAQARASEGSSKSGDTSGSYAVGLYRVPYNGFVMETHRNERLLTAQEAQYVPRDVTTIGQSAPVIDVEALASALQKGKEGNVYVSFSIGDEVMAEYMEPKISELQGRRLHSKGW